MLPENPPADVAERLDAVVAEFTRMILETEAQQRTMLRLSLEQAAASSSACRCGRAGPSPGSPRRSPRSGTDGDKDIHRLVLAIRSATGIESLVWLTDVGGLSREARRRLPAVDGGRPAQPGPHGRADRAPAPASPEAPGTADNYVTWRYPA